MWLTIGLNLDLLTILCFISEENLAYTRDPKFCPISVFYGGWQHSSYGTLNNTTCRIRIKLEHSQRSIKRGYGVCDSIFSYSHWRFQKNEDWGVKFNIQWNHSRTQERTSNKHLLSIVFWVSIIKTKIGLALSISLVCNSHIIDKGPQPRGCGCLLKWLLLSF